MIVGMSKNGPVVCPPWSFAGMRLRGGCRRERDAVALFDHRMNQGDLIRVQIEAPGVLFDFEFMEAVNR